MKQFFSALAILPFLTIQGFSQTPAAPAAPAAPPVATGPEMPTGMLIFKDQPAEKIFLIAGTIAQVRYKETAQAIDTKDINLSEVERLYIFEPKIYRDAMELYQARKYAEAKDLFAQSKTAYKSLASLPNNYSTLGSFYELECMRRLGDLEGLAKSLEGFRKEGLTREHQLRQLEIYVFWDAVRTKSWERLVALGKERLQEKLPSYQRAQVAFCVAQAYEALKNESAALNTYNIAMLADAGATEEITEQSAQAIMRIHLANPGVQLAMKLWGTPDENKSSSGYLHLQEAGAVAALYQFTLGGGKALPSQFNLLLKYKPDVAKPDPADPKPDDKKPDEKKPPGKGK
jgi:hypothetical protein